MRAWMKKQKTKIWLGGIKENLKSQPLTMTIQETTRTAQVRSRVFQLFHGLSFSLGRMPALPVVTNGSYRKA